MSYLAWIISCINIYLGIRHFLNAINVLRSSKYSQGATGIFAILFLGMGIAGLYFSLAKNNDSLSLIIGIGPWAIGLVFLLFNMLTSDYK